MLKQDACFIHLNFVHMFRTIWQITLLSIYSLVSCGPSGNNNNTAPPPGAKTPLITYTVAATLPHDTSRFTEGLEFYQGKMIESTGLEEKSKLVMYDVETGKVEKEISLDPRSFGEGVTVFNDTVYQLTYRESKVNVYDVKNFAKLKELPFTGEGWGLTHDSTRLIATNGSNNLYFFEPGTFRSLGKIEVLENGQPAVNLNELEYINGYVYANQWQMNSILKIDPATGEVVAKMDVTGIVQEEKARNPVAEFLNGIAYNPQNGKVYITGKNWSRLYQVNFQF